MSVTRKSTDTKRYLEAALIDLQTDLTVKVGFFESARYPNTTSKSGKTQVGPPVAYVGAIQELGDPTHKIPPHPYLRPTAKQQAPAVRNIANRGLKQIVKGEIKAKELLDLIGQKMAGEVRKSISQITSPALKQSTIIARARKYANRSGKRLTLIQALGSSKPLVDTKVLINHVTSLVEPE